MISKLKAFYCLLITCTFQLMATTVTMQELFNPDLKQTVILGGDVHLKQGAHELNDWMRFFEKYKALAIIETQSIPGEIAPENEVLLSALEKNLKQSSISHYFPEFRVGYGCLAVAITQSFNKNYKEKEELWNTPEIKSIVYFGCRRAKSDAITILNEVKESIYQLRESNVLSDETSNELFDELDKLGQLYNTINDSIKAVLSPEYISEEVERDSIVSFIFKDRYIENADGSASLSSNSTYDKIQDLHCQLLDLRIVMHILKHQDQKVAAVMAGCVHTENIGSLLSKVGYQIKSQNDDDLKAIKLYWKERGKQEPGFLTSDEFMKYQTLKHLLTLDIPTFIEACSTLKN